MTSIGPKRIQNQVERSSTLLLFFFEVCVGGRAGATKDMLEFNCFPLNFETSKAHGPLSYIVDKMVACATKESNDAACFNWERVWTGTPPERFFASLCRTRGGKSTIPHTPIHAMPRKSAPRIVTVSRLSTPDARRRIDAKFGGPEEKLECRQGKRT